MAVIIPEKGERDGNHLKNLSKGMYVEIFTNKGKLIKGYIEEMGSRKEFDSDGIMVILQTGEVGRVKKILTEKVSVEVEPLIKKGESSKLELKADALWSINKTEQEIKESKSYDLHTYRHKASKVIIARAIAALLNSEGGNLIIGVKEKKDHSNNFDITGIEEDLNRLKSIGKDASKDGYKRMIIDDIIRPYFPPKIYNRLNQYIKIEFEEVNEKIVCNIKVKKSDSRIFLNLEGRKLFMIRTETESRQIVDEELVDYCMSRFLH
ncbi:MAG: RNA-binding domain-containing protein [Nanobdellota archaeon]